MKFNDLPTSYRLVRLDESELADAIDGWLQREHPNVVRMGTLNATVTFVAYMPIKVNRNPIQPLHASVRTPPKKRQKGKYNRQNAGIGVHLKAIFSDNMVHDVGVIYTILKPKFPKLTRKKLIHNFYAIKGIDNLGKFKWQLPKID